MRIPASVQDSPAKDADDPGGAFGNSEEYRKTRSPEMAVRGTPSTTMFR